MMHVRVKHLGKGAGTEARPYESQRDGLAAM